MDLQQFIANFANLFDETDVAMFTPETKFHDLEEWSSLVALSIVAMVDEEYDIEVKGDELRSAITIEDLFNLVSKKA